MKCCFLNEPEWHFLLIIMMDRASKIRRDCEITLLEND